MANSLCASYAPGFAAFRTSRDGAEGDPRNASGVIGAQARIADVVMAHSTNRGHPRGLDPIVVL